MATKSKTLIIHIGTEKTGTTSLQAFLHENAASLERHGIWYPTDASAAYCQGTAHFPIPGSLVESHQDFVSPSKAQGLRSAVSEFCADADKRLQPITLISSEHFSSRVRDPAKLAAFRDALRPHFKEIRIACYIRRQPDMALSSYHTGIVTGRRTRLDPSYVSVENPYFNYLKMLDLWADTFGRRAITVREYGKASLKNEDICQDFCAHVLGVDGSSFLPVPARNASRGAVFLELVRQVNLVLPSIEESVSGWRSAQQIRSTLLRNLAINNDVPLAFHEQDERELVRRFGESNRVVNERYMGGSMSAAWFNPDIPARAPDAEWVTEKTMTAMSSLIVELLKSQAARGAAAGAAKPRAT